MADPKKTILVVEDDPIYAEFIRSSLVTAGLPVILQHVSTLEQAIAYTKGEKPYNDRSVYPLPRIVLLDLHLSTHHGFPFLRFLRDNGFLENQKTRVIMLTASSRTEDLQEALRLGAISYLVKNPIASTIINVVSNFLPE